MKNRSSWASGRGYVPSCSRGFSVAMTKNGEGRVNVSFPIVTWDSSMASRSADWTFGGVRLISSARSMLVNIGHFRISNLPVCGRYISTPVRSVGRRSGVNDIRFISYQSTFARVFIAFVFPRPGTHSISACPPEKSVMISLRMRSGWPMISSPMSCSRLIMISRVEERWGFMRIFYDTKSI